jgi:Bacterial protein of unknown function (DUF885)
MKHPMAFIAPFIFVLLMGLSMTPFPVPNPSAPNPSQSKLFDALAQEYTDTYKLLDVPPLELSWKANMTAELKGAAQHKGQEKFFREMQNRLRAFDAKTLNTCQNINRKILSYETQLNLARLPIAQKYAQNPPANLSDLGTASFAQGRDRQWRDWQGRDWYEWYLKKWLTTDMTPRDIQTFGEVEIDKGLANLAKLEADIVASGAATSIAEFIETKSTSYGDDATILAAFNARQTRISQNIDRLFMPYDIIPLGIKPNTNPAMIAVPGYYSPPDFYYSWDGKSYRAQDTDFLYMHEGVPGHHFQSQIADKYNICTFIMPQIFYLTFAEGWAAYVETLGTDLGVYDSFETRLGAIDWNLIRSVRTYLDVAINRDGWNDDRAKAYWQGALPPHLHKFAPREIKRMRDWPAQVITYKVGADAILKLKAKEQQRLGKDFDIRKFHDTLLRMGPVPLDILEEAYTTLVAPER